MRSKVAVLLTLVALAGCANLTSALAATDPDAVAFGELPRMWGARLSPDGSMISFLHMDEQTDRPVAIVLRDDGTLRPVMGKANGDFEIRWCRWANDTRLVCEFQGSESYSNMLIAATRLAAVNADGSDPIALLQKGTNTFAANRAYVVDWLPEEPDQVLIRVQRLGEKGGTGLRRLDVYTGATSPGIRGEEGTWAWITDGRGTPRMKQFVRGEISKWYVRMPDSEDWELLHESSMSDLDDNWFPIGFGSDPNMLMVVKPHNNRLALWESDITRDEVGRVIFSRDDVDVQDIARMGKYNRLAAAIYSTDRTRRYFFDQDLNELVARLAKALPDQTVEIADESWDARYYLIRGSSDTDPGRYYRFDAVESKLAALQPVRPRLQDKPLAEVASAPYPARDGLSIPAYLTLPPDVEPDLLPAVLIAGPGVDRDAWGFNWLTQFLATRGFAVLQNDFRRSSGLGMQPSGEGEFREWRQRVNDLVDGANWLVESGVADPEKICVMGWGFGGYLALMSAVEGPDIFACAISMGGATDPESVAFRTRGAIDHERMRAAVVATKDVFTRGSPLKRAKEVRTPVLLAHGKQDVDFEVAHSQRMHKALRRAKVESKSLIYDDIGHDLWRNEYRVGLLDNVGRFLDSQLAD